MVGAHIHGVRILDPELHAGQHLAFELVLVVPEVGLEVGVGLPLAGGGRRTACLLGRSGQGQAGNAGSRIDPLLTGDSRQVHGSGSFVGFHARQLGVDVHEWLRHAENVCITNIFLQGSQSYTHCTYVMTLCILYAVDTVAPTRRKVRKKEPAATP